VLSPDAGLRHQKIYALFPADLKTLPLALGEFSRKSPRRYRRLVQGSDPGLQRRDCERPDYLYLCHWTDGTGGGAWKDSDLYNDKVDAIGAA
jgi:hypothetical protein